MEKSSDPQFQKLLRLFPRLIQLVTHSVKFELGNQLDLW